MPDADTIAPCDTCGSHDSEVIANSDRRGNPLQTAICKQCGLVFHAQIPSVAELEEFYQFDYRKQYNGEETPSDYRVGREWKRGQLLYKLLRSSIDGDETVFEVGAGIGCNLKQFELAGHQVSGIEPGEGFSGYAQRTLQVDVQQAVLEELPTHPQFDLVLLVHVLEHLRSAQQSLMTIHKMLNPGGLLFVDVPNLAAHHAAPGKQFHFAHIYNFTPKTLTTAAKAAGFAVEKPLSKVADRNLRVLFRKAGRQMPHPDPAAYQQAKRAVTRYNTLTYHCRPSYLIDRAGSLLRQAGDRLLASRRMKKIMVASQSSGRQASPSTARRAA